MRNLRTNALVKALPLFGVYPDPGSELLCGKSKSCYTIQITLNRAGHKGAWGHVPPPPPRRGRECPKKLIHTYDIASIYINA